MVNMQLVSTDEAVDSRLLTVVGVHQLMHSDNSLHVSLASLVETLFYLYHDRSLGKCGGTLGLPPYLIIVAGMC